MPTNQYGQTEWDADPETAAELRRLANQEKMAAEMMKRGQVPLTGGMVGQTYVGASPLQGIANMLHQYNASKAAQNAEEGYKALGAKRAEGERSAWDKVSQAMRGTPATPDSMVPMAVGGNPDEQAGDRFQAGAAAVPGSIDAAMQAGMESPYTRKISQAMLLEKMKHQMSPKLNEPFTLKPGDVRYGADGKPIVSSPNKPVYENATPLAKLLEERAVIEKANPLDPRLKKYDDAIEKETKTTRQISPTINMPSAKFSNVQSDGKGGWIGQNAAGVMVQIPVEGGVKGKDGELNLAGGRESVQVGRLIGSANQASRDLENIAKLPLTANSGFFGGRGQGQGLLEAGKETLTNKMTTQEVQSYNAMTAGLQRSLASLEAMGLMPNVNLTKQMDAVVFRDGDTHLTKMHKLAQTRQIIEATQETLDANPRVSKEQKLLLKKVLERTEKVVPFTHSDLIDLNAAQQKNPSASMKSILAAREKSSAATGGDAPAGWSKEEWGALTAEEKASLVKKP